MTYKECVKLIRSDYYRIEGKTDSMIKMLMYTIWDRGFHFLFWWRLSHLDNRFLSFMPRFISRCIGTSNHIHIERNTKIGYGFKINQGGPLVINSSATIGNNVNIGQNTTIGSLYLNAATIGDNVYIGPSVCIVENVTIGSGSTIGAGAVVVKDVPENATVAGNPAKVISWKEPGRLVWNKWPMNK